MKGIITEEEVKKAYSRATDSMSRLNRWVNSTPEAPSAYDIQVGGNIDAQIWSPRCN